MNGLVIAVGIASIVGCAIAFVSLFVRVGVYHGSNVAWRAATDQRLERIERSMNGFLMGNNHNHGGENDS